MPCCPPPKKPRCSYLTVVRVRLTAMTEHSNPSTAAASITAPDGADLPDVGLLRVDHVGIAVPDLDAAIAFYEQSFGMRCVHEEVNEEQGVREAMLAVGDPSGARVQLLAPLRPDSAIAKFLERSGQGV